MNATRPLLDLILDYEMGDLDEDNTVAMFQRIVDAGMHRTLQGTYGRTAAALASAGLIVMR